MTRSDSKYWPKPTSNTIMAEIGIKHGDSSKLFAKHLNNKGMLYLFDYHDRVDAVIRELHDAKFYNVRGFGNSYKLFDSYNWSLMKLITDNDREILDYIYFDGAHTLHHDGLAAFMCLRLLKVGGYIDIDDYDHTHAMSENAGPGMRPSELRPYTNDAFTDEQISSKQVSIVVDLVIRDDYRMEEVVPNKVFRKVQR